MLLIGFYLLKHSVHFRLNLCLCLILQNTCDRFVVFPIFCDSFHEDLCLFACPLDGACTFSPYTRTQNVTIGMVLVRFHLLTKPVYVASYLDDISCLNCFCDQVVFVAALLNSFHASFVLFICPICPENACECFAFGCLRVYLCLSSLLQSTCQCCTWCLWFYCLYLKLLVLSIWECNLSVLLVFDLAFIAGLHLMRIVNYVWPIYVLVLCILLCRCCFLLFVPFCWATKQWMLLCHRAFWVLWPSSCFHLYLNY